MNVIHDDAVGVVLADPRRFTGPVWRSNFIEPVDADHLAGLRFVYAPGARSFWHVHEREQAIVAVHGHGLVAWEGLDAPIRLHAGDWWHVEPGIAHWHGATPDTSFAHIAVTAGGGTTWLHEVADDAYRTPPAGAGTVRR